MADRPRRRRGGQSPTSRSPGLSESWQRLNFEQRAAAIGAVLLVVSTFGPFSFVELAVLLVAGAVLYLLRQRAEGRTFHLPFGDGTIIFAAGIWSALLILVRLFDRPLGQGLLALVCATILVLAGVRERSRRPPDDVPPGVRPGPDLAPRRDPVTRRARRSRPGDGPPDPAAADTARAADAPTERLPGAEPVPEPEAPPELEPPGDREPPLEQEPAGSDPDRSESR